MKKYLCVNFGMRMTGLLFLFFMSLSFSACTSIEIEEIAKPLAETAAGELSDLAKTEAAKAKDKIVEMAETEVKSIETTSLPELATQAIGKLTPQPASTAQPPKSDEIVNYTVAKGDNLSKIALAFSLDLDELIALNKDRYPSLLNNPNHVEVGWILIVSTGSGNPISPPPEPAPAVVRIPTPCDQSSVWWIDDFDCEPYRLDVVTEIGVSLGCVVLDENPLGYFKTHTIYDGWVITKNGYIFSYGWFIDKEKNQVVIGPAVINTQTNYVECGIPGNP